MEQDFIRWRAYENNDPEHPDDWYWALAILALAFSLTAVILGNIVFAVLIIVSAFSIALHAKKTPDIYEFELNTKGVRINDKIYPYQTLEAFWIEEEFNPQIILRSNKKLMPYIFIPLGDEDIDLVRNYLIQVLEEKPMRESLFHKIAEFLGV